MSCGIDWFAWDGNGQHPGLQAAIRNDGVTYAYVRASFSTSEDDFDPGPAIERADDVMQQIEAAGLTAGAYMMPDYRLGGAPAKEQVQAFADAAKLHPGRLPPILDVEFGGRGIAGTGRTRLQVADFIGELLDAMEVAIPNVWLSVYSSRRVCDDVDVDCLAGAATEQTRRCDWFIARYPIATNTEARPDLAGKLSAPPTPRAAGDDDNWWDHQFQGDAIHVAGFAGHVDVNRWNYFTAKSSHGRRYERVAACLGKALGGGVPTDMDAAIMSYQSMVGRSSSFRQLRPTQTFTADGVIGPATWAWLAWNR